MLVEVRTVPLHSRRFHMLPVLVTLAIADLPIEPIIEIIGPLGCLRGTCLQQASTQSAGNRINDVARPTSFAWHAVFPCSFASAHRLTPMPSTPSPTFDASALGTPSAVSVDKAQGERHKLIGTAQMSAERYEQAIDSYTKAISSDPLNAVHYSNRAAAYSMAGDHPKAIKDAEDAIAIDPSFVKAYQRLG